MSKNPINLKSLVAKPGFAPEDWQSPHPRTVNPGWGLPPVPMSEDVARVIGLPRRPPVEPKTNHAETLKRLISSLYNRDGVTGCECQAKHKRACIKSLNWVQSWALSEMRIKGGLVGAIGVGHGKTILNLLSPLAVKDVKVAVLLVPPGLVDQLIEEYRLLSQHFRVPTIRTHGRRKYHAKQPSAPVLHVYPYSLLSRPDATDWLEKVKPDLIIADECHKLRHRDTATTSRVLRYMNKHPETRFCGWSGSVADKSIKDYAHISAMGLKAGSPLPIDPVAVADWAKAVDPDSEAPAGALLKLCSPGQKFTEGFHRRLVETPGFIATADNAIEAEIFLEERKAPELPEKIANALDEVRLSWTRPDGEELVEALELAKCCKELACGFYYRWIFPNKEPVQDILEWLAARKDWHKELRYKLKPRQEHLDSPFLCIQAVKRAYGQIEITKENEHLPRWKAQCWHRWAQIKDKVHPQTDAVRIDDYLARDSAEWGKAHQGIIWYEHNAFGRWVAEISGLPIFGGGAKAAKRIIKESGERSIIASIKSHGTGRDGLQRLFDQQLIANPPASPTAWEQLLGRLHRIGQESDKVVGWFYRHTPELRESVDKALTRALFIENTLGSSQKLRTGFKFDKPQ